MAARIRELEQAQTAPAAAAPAPSGVTPESVVAQYGEDFASAVTSIATAETSRLRDDFASQVESMREATAQSARSNFLRDLAQLVPNFAEIDREPGFTAYLDEFDAQTGRTRREFFTESDAGNNAARTAAFFAAYANGKRPAPTPAPAPAAPKSVEHLIQPTSSRQSEAPPGKKLWSRAEIGRFYADSRARPGSKPYGLYTADEYERIDADIGAASAEGRIR